LAGLRGIMMIVVIAIRMIVGYRGYR